MRYEKNMSISREYFTVVIVGADSKPVAQREPLVFVLHDGEEYSLQLINHHPKLRSNARIFIDGKEVMYVRIEKNSFVSIERPVNVAAKFTFVRADPNAEPSNPERGVLTVDFELETDVRCQQTGEDCVDGGLRGETVFGRRSNQQFRDAIYMPSTYSTTIRAIMIVDDSPVTIA